MTLQAVVVRRRRRRRRRRLQRCRRFLYSLRQRRRLLLVAVDYRYFRRLLLALGHNNDGPENFIDFTASFLSVFVLSILFLFLIQISS